MSYKPKASQCLSVMLLLKYATGRTTFTQVDQLKARNCQLEKYKFFTKYSEIPPLETSGFASQEIRQIKLFSKLRCISISTRRVRWPILGQRPIQRTTTVHP